jgi:hypothetical protein
MYYEYMHRKSEAERYRLENENMSLKKEREFERALNSLPKTRPVDAEVVQFAYSTFRISECCTLEDLQDETRKQEWIGRVQGFGLAGGIILTDEMAFCHMQRVAYKKYQVRLEKPWYKSLGEFFSGPECPSQTW